MPYQKLKSYRLGEERLQECGLIAKIISYPYGSDMTVQFEDGKIIEHVSYYDFSKGTLNYNKQNKPEYALTFRVGEKIVCSNEMVATIIAYRNHNDIDVQFDDGYVVEHISYTRFYQAGVPHPDHKPVIWPRNLEKHIGLKKRTLDGYRELLAVHDDGTIDYIDDNGIVIHNGSSTDFFRKNMWLLKGKNWRTRKIREKQLRTGRMRFDLICVGMALVDSIIKGFDPEPISASGFRAASGTLNVGGEAVNEAIAASKLGLRTAILCSLGRDGAGEMVKAALNEADIDTRFIIEGPSTPVTTMFVNDDGTRKSITNEAHRYNFHPESSLSVLADTRAIIFGSLFRAPFDDPEIIYAVVRTASEMGKLIIADTKLPNFRRLTLDDLSKSLPLIDFITPNEDEARYFTGKEDPEEMADVFLSYGVKNVIIKLGGKGCMLKNREKSIRLPAYQIEAVDATGAGDNFVAGFASAIIRGVCIEDALRFGNACGAICTTAVGAGTALKSREQVQDWIKETGE